MKRKFDLDAAVASELGLSIAEVKDITTAFLERLRAHLVDEEAVHLAGFGRFRVVVSPGSEEPHELTTRKKKQLYTTHRKVRVHFSKAEPFDRLLRAKMGPASEKKS